MSGHAPLGEGDRPVPRARTIPWTTKLFGGATRDAHREERLTDALALARGAIHDLCLERGSPEGYRVVLDHINAALGRVNA